MSVWHVTERDRDEAGRIRLLSDLLPPAAPEEEHDAPTRARWHPSRLDIAGIVGGLLLATILIAGLNVFWPAPAPRLPSPTAAPAPTQAPTRTATATQAPTATPEPPTATMEPPTQEVIYVPVEPPCDPTANPRYSVHLDVSPLGSVTGVSCDSLEDATANAEALRAAMLATAGTP